MLLVFVLSKSTNITFIIYPKKAMHRNFNNWNKIKQYLQSCQQAFSKQYQIRSSVALQSQKWFPWNVKKTDICHSVQHKAEHLVLPCLWKYQGISIQIQDQLYISLYRIYQDDTENEECEFHVDCYHGLTIKLYLFPCRLTHYVVISFQIHWN